MNKLALFSLILFSIILSSCTRSYMVKTESTKFNVEQVNVLSVAYHRPDYAPAEHDDFKNKSRVLSCEHPESLWINLVKNEVKIRECLNSIDDAKAVYFYVPANQPYLELDLEEEKNPSCLKLALPKILLPREIYYTGNQEGQTLDEDPLECFSSSFSIDTNQLMLTPTGFLKKKIVIPFPLDRTLKKSQDLTMWLLVTTFTILKSDEKAGGKLLASPVPESVCKACFKHDALFDDKFSRKIKPVFWP